jgi:hypothetical protein
MRSKNEVLCAAAGRLAAERSEADKPAKAHKTIFAPNNIQDVAQLTPQRKLTCADSNNITGKPVVELCNSDRKKFPIFPVYSPQRYHVTRIVHHRTSPLRLYLPISGKTAPQKILKNI